MYVSAFGLRACVHSYVGVFAHCITCNIEYLAAYGSYALLACLCVCVVWVSIYFLFTSLLCDSVHRIIYNYACVLIPLFHLAVLFHITSHFQPQLHLWYQDLLPRKGTSTSTTYKFLQISTRRFSMYTTLQCFILPHICDNDGHWEANYLKLFFKNFVKIQSWKHKHRLYVENYWLNLSLRKTNSLGRWHYYNFIILFLAARKFPFIRKKKIKTHIGYINQYRFSQEDYWNCLNWLSCLLSNRYAFERCTQIHFLHFLHFLFHQSNVGYRFLAANLSTNVVEKDEGLYFRRRAN